MKSRRNILITLILFAVTLFCFEVYTHVHCSAHLYNVENTSESSTSEEKCISFNESYDDCKNHSTIDFSCLNGSDYIIMHFSALTSTYINSFWQPPKIS